MKSQSCDMQMRSLDKSQRFASPSAAYIFCKPFEHITVGTPANTPRPPPGRCWRPAGSSPPEGSRRKQSPCTSPVRRLSGFPGMHNQRPELGADPRQHLPGQETHARGCRERAAGGDLDGRAGVWGAGPLDAGRCEISRPARARWSIPDEEGTARPPTGVKPLIAP